MFEICFAICWLLVLIFIGFWIALLVAPVYIFLLPFSVCIPICEGLTDMLLQVVQFPRYCAIAMMEGKFLP